MEANFAKRKGNDQSGKVDNEVFVFWSFFLFDLHVVKGRKVRSKMVISEVCFEMSQLFGVNELLSLFPNVVKCSRFCLPIFILKMATKDPHFSEVNEVRRTVRILL